MRVPHLREAYILSKSHINDDLVSRSVTSGVCPSCTGILIVTD